MVNTLRSQVIRYIDSCDNFEALYRSEYEMYRADCLRDGEWYSEVEPLYLWRWDAARRTLGTSDRWTAMSAAGYARLLHEQGRYEEGGKAWEQARELWSIAEPVSAEERAIVLVWIDAALVACRESAKPEANPEYRVPLDCPNGRN
jgi:hypothetical protein